MIRHFRRFPAPVLLLVAGGLALGTSSSATTVAYYRFEEGAANTSAAGSNSVQDASGNGLHETPVGGPTYRADVAIGTLPPAAINMLALEFNGSQRVFIPDDTR